MTMERLKQERLQADIAALAAFGGRESGGVNRRAFSSDYRNAVSWLQSQMGEAGLAVRIDPAGNVIGRLGPANGPAVICGSHIDSVPSGGRFDGALGVLAGLECARALRAMGKEPVRALEVVAFVDEEGAFYSLLGSRAMTGCLRPNELIDAVAIDGERLSEAMFGCGLDIRYAHKAGRPTTDFDCMIEFHVEQGPTLEKSGVNVGIVDSVVGLALARFTLNGQAAHSGTTPVTDRCDALRGAAEAVAQTYDIFEHELAPGARLNYGTLLVEPGASNVVPQRVVTTCEIRAAEEEDIQRLAEEMEGIFSEVASARDLSLEVQQVSYDPPVTFSTEMVSELCNLATKFDLSYSVMPSGAGHDAQSFAPVCPTAMIFVPSKGGDSHTPKEYTSPEEIAKGLRLLYQFLEQRLFSPK